MTPRAREHRFRRLKEMGCIACWKDGRLDVYPEIHHLNLGGRAGQKRRGDEFTIPLCRWHHQGHDLPGLTIAERVELWGPSLKLHSRAFRDRYGSDDELLAKVNDIIRQRDEMAFGWQCRALDAATERANALKWPHHSSEAQRLSTTTGEEP
jgi:hypothetical protein